MVRSQEAVAPVYAGGERRKGTLLEKHVQTILSGVILLLMGWVGITLLGLLDRTTKLEERSATQVETIKQLRSELQNSTQVDRASVEARIAKDAEVRLEVQLLKDRVTRIESNGRSR